MHLVAFVKKEHDLLRNKITKRRILYQAAN